MRASAMVGALMVCTSSVAFADAIDDAMAELEIGEVERARGMLEAVTPPDRATLIRLLEARARLAHATRDDAAMTSALRALDALEPEHAFGPSVPPELGERLRAMDTPRLSLSVTSAELGTGLSLVVRVDDAVGLSRDTRLFVRVDGETVETRERSFAVPLAAGGRGEAWAELRGEGGVVLATWGRESTPHAIARSADPSGELSPEPGVPPEHEVGDPLVKRRRIILGAAVAGIVLLAVGAAVGVVVYGKNNRDARLGQPFLVE